MWHPVWSKQKTKTEHALTHDLHKKKIFGQLTWKCVQPTFNTIRSSCHGDCTLLNCMALSFAFPSYTAGHQTLSNQVFSFLFPFFHPVNFLNKSFNLYSTIPSGHSLMYNAAWTNSVTSIMHLINVAKYLRMSWKINSLQKNCILKTNLFLVKG